MLAQLCRAGRCDRMNRGAAGARLAGNTNSLPPYRYLPSATVVVSLPDALHQKQLREQKSGMVQMEPRFIEIGRPEAR